VESLKSAVKNKTPNNRNTSLIENKTVQTKNEVVPALWEPLAKVSLFTSTFS
jgi:hypothetical protein